jgi:sterol desaturase/sphingolipid hydroxylase (fatty acid hydroxylase superfamily)
VGILAAAPAARVSGAVAAARQHRHLLLNIALAAFIFAPRDIFRPQLETVFGLTLPSWPIADHWSSFVVAFLLLDFLNYAMHRCQHAVTFLWRFHAMHHSDPDVDATISVRHHPIEYLLATGSIG